MDGPQARRPKVTGDGHARTRALAAEVFGEFPGDMPVYAVDQRPASPPVERPARRSAGGTATPSRRRPAADRTTVEPAAVTSRTVARRRPATTRAATRPPRKPSRALAHVDVSSRPRLALAVLSTSALLGVLMAVLPGVTIPSLSSALHVTAAQARWTVTMPLVGMGVAVPIAAGLGDRLGAARLLRWALVALAVTSALGALAWNLGVLLVLRTAGGLAAGLVVPASMALLLRLRPGRAWAAGVLGGGLLLLPALLPALGAWLVGGMEWRLLPLAGALASVLALAGAFLWLRPVRGEGFGRRADVAGIVTAALALGSLMLALLGGPQWGWASSPVLGLLCVCGVSLGLLVVVELSLPEPLIDPAMLRPSAAMVAPLLLAAAAAIVAAGVFELPVLLQGAGPIGAATAGVTLLVPAAITALAMAAAVLLGGRAGARWPVTAGLLLAALGSYLLHGVPPQDTARLVLAACVRGAGLGLALAPLTAAVASAARRVASSAAVVGLCVLVPAAAGGAVLGSALTVPAWTPGSQGASATLQERLVLLHGDVALPLSGATFLDTVLLAAAIASIGALIALRLPVRSVRTAD